jgi:hypothetical protein
MRTLLKVLGAIWTLIGLRNLFAMFWIDSSQGIQSSVFMFNLLLFVLPGLVVYGIGVRKVQKHIEANNPGITGLGVNFNNGVVSLSGQAASADAMEKAVLLAGNVQGVADVKIDGLQSPPITEKVEY